MFVEGTGHQRVESTPSDGEDLFQAIFSQAAIGIAQIGLDGKWLLVNNRFCEMLGYSEAELREKNLQDITHPDDRDESLAGRRQLLAGEILSHTMEKRYIRKDGTVFWGKLSRSLARDHDAIPKYFIAVVEDITGKMQAERALRDSERHLAVARQEASLGVWDCDLQTNTTVFSGEYARLHGLPPDHPPLTHEKWLETVHPADRERVQQLLRECFDHTHFWGAEFRVVWPDGSIHWLLGKGQVLLDDSGEPVRLTGVTLDITDRKQAEDALRESEQRYKEVFDLTSDCIFLLDVTSDGRFKFAGFSPAEEQAIGLSSAEVSGRFVEDVLAEDLARKVIANYRRCLELGRLINYEEELDLPMGRRHFQVNLIPARNSAGSIYRIVGVARDITERTRADAALRESEERFRSMADGAPVMIWVAGPDKQCTFFNGPWLEFAGHTMEQELADGWVSRIHPQDLAQCLTTYHSSFDACHSFQMEYRLRRADGAYRWILDNGKPLYRGREFVGFIGSCIDITDQKLIEERLRANEVQLTEAQRLARVGSFEVHIDCDRMYWSDEISRIFGAVNRGPSDFARFLQSVHPKDREKVLESSRKVRSTGATVETEYRIVRPDGEVRFVRSIVEPIRNDQGETVRLGGATQDLTEQVQARELLRESEARLKNAERLAHLGHWQWHLKSNQLIWSDECYRIFGQLPNYTPSLEDLLQTLIPEDRERVQRETGHRLAEKKGGPIEFRIVWPDGKLRTIRSVSEMLLDEEGEPESFFGACQDITEEKRAQEESVARQKLESVGTLANGIAHDFNNLLGGVLAQAELALGELAGGSNPEAELRAIRDTALRGSEIVRELMIYAGKESSVVEPIDVSQIVKEILELLKVSVSKHAALEADLGKNVAAARGNAAQIRQVVMNLVTNASDAIGDRDGVIRVSTREVTINRDSGPISDRLADGDYVQLDVSDTGCGMSLETQAKVFDPFFTTKSAGHGLGLAIVQGLVRSLGGSTHLTSEPGKGTTIQILLPAAEGAAGSAGDALSNAAEPTDLSLNTVLVVEDEHLLRQAVAKMLRKSGFKVLEAADGSTAIDILRANAGSIDVIFLDISIPGASPLEVVAESEKARADTRVLLTSAYSQEMIANTMSTPQIRGFIRKPFQLGDLLRVLRETLSS